MTILGSLMKLWGRSSMKDYLSKSVSTFKKLSGRFDADGFTEKMAERGSVICTIPDNGDEPEALVLIWKKSDLNSKETKALLESLKKQGFRLTVSTLEN